ncbi:MAG: hypothetical protein GY853_06975 [PVC group bacterium]|nr:hypothetical protein [PVC group bacterium]
MKKTLVMLLIIGFAVLSATAAFAESKDTLVSVTADYWMPSVDAEVKSSELGLLGSKININDDLGIDDSETIPSLKASVDLPLFPEVIVSYFTIDGSGSKNITKALSFKGINYTAATNVTSSYDITHFEGLLAWSFLNQDFTKLGVVLGVKYFEVETSLKDNTTGITKKEDVAGPVPVVGIIGAVGLPGNVKLETLARGVVLEVGDVDAALFDVDLGLHYDFNKFFRASLGYRYFSIDAEDSKENDTVDVKFTGPYIGLTGSF